MKKIALTLILMIAISYAANESLFGDSYVDSLLQDKGALCWQQVYCDTLLLDGLDGDTTIDLGGWGYNFMIRSLNTAAESCFYDIAFDSYKGIFHNDSIARNLLWERVGWTAGVGNQNWFVAPIRASKIYCRPGFPGADVGVDSTVLLEIRYVR